MPEDGAPEYACSLCPVYRPGKPARLPNHPPVCDGDRTLIDRHHLEIGRLVDELGNDHADIADERVYVRYGYQGQPLGLVWACPVGALGGVAPINSRPKAPSVSGSREAPIPIQVARVDLAAPARVPALSDAARRWLDDQTGFLSAATILDQWCRDIRDVLFPDHHLPAAFVPEMVDWLRNRLPEVCDRHPAVAEYAREIRDLRGALRAVAGESEPPPQRCDVPCKRCDLLMLFRQSDGDVECVNPDCRAVYRPDEYDAWVREHTAGRHAAVAG